MNKSMTLLFLACCVMAAPVFAKKAKDETVVKADTPDNFAVVAAAVRKEMAPDGRYEFISNTGRSEVNALLDGMAALLEKSGSVAAMPEADKMKLFNDQELVNGLLAQNASDRLVCTHVAPVGSHIPVTKCKTYGQLASSRRDSQRIARELTDQARADMQGAAMNQAREDYAPIGGN